MKRVPVILQMTANECGAACLAMVLTYHGRETTLNACRKYLHGGRDGLTARAIAQAARELGLRVRAFSLEPAALSEIDGPAIIHWNFEHFLVLEQWSPSGVNVVDPALGRRQLSVAEFSAGFTGVALTFEPGENFQKQRASNKISWRSYLRDLLQMPAAKGLLVQVFGASVLLQLLGLIFPLFTLILIDTVLPEQNMTMLNMLGIGMVLLVLAQAFLDYLRGALALYLEARLDSGLMLGFFDHVMKLPLRFFQERTSGDLLMRLSSIAVIREVLTSQTVSAVLDGMMTLFYLIILFVWQPWIGLLALEFGFLQVILLLFSTRPLYELAERDLAAQAESQSYLVEALAGIATLKATASEHRATDHWKNLFFKQLNISLQRSHLSNLVETFRDVVGALAPIILLWIGGLWVLNGSMTLGTMLAVTTLATSFLGPLSSLVSTGQQLQLIGAHLERISDVLETTSEQDTHAVQVAPRLSGQIEMRNASFRYHAHAPWAVRDVSVDIAPGQKVALVGRTGSGKSTLAMLLLGLYPLDEGEILYDDQQLHQLDYRSVRSQIGVVLQEPALFGGSIRRNIAAHDENLSLRRIIEAAQLAAIHDEIIGLPMGYDTVISEGGGDLSGGQRQRLAIARALAHRPSILLLDEASSDLDVMTENTVDQHLSDLKCTRIVIAHRLSTVRNADLILVLEDGFIVEQGTHTSLLALDGTYAALVNNQEATFGIDAATRLHLYNGIELVAH